MQSKRSNFKKRKMKSLTKKQQELYKNAKICYIYKEKFENEYLKDKKYLKVRDAAHRIWNLIYYVPKKIPMVFRNGSNYDYHFITKQLTEKLKKQVICWGVKNWKMHNLYNSYRKKS